MPVVSRLYVMSLPQLRKDFVVPSFLILSVYREQLFHCSIQGTMGHPKATLATHHILVNNAIIAGKWMELNAEVLYTRMFTGSLDMCSFDLL
jgi:hypothetical protein